MPIGMAVSVLNLLLLGIVMYVLAGAKLVRLEFRAGRLSEACEGALEDALRDTVRGDTLAVEGRRLGLVGCFLGRAAG